MNFPPVQVLMVAEKPSIARTIAQALSPQVHTERKQTHHEVHYFPHYFFQMPCLVKVTSVVGHIFSTDFTPEFNGNDVDPHKLFDAPTIKKFSSPSSSIIKHLQNEAKGCNFLVLWLDNDREGENICFEVIQVCDGFMNVIDRTTQYIFRAKFSSITQTDIQNAYMQLYASPDLNQSLAVDARQILDLKSKYNIQGKKKISYGPCQTPTLAFCVERHDEIQNFKPQTYYSLSLKIKEDVAIEWNQGQTFDIEEAKRILSEVQNNKQLLIKDIQTTEATKSRPVGLNTVNMLKIASRKYDLGPHDAMYIAESLYLSGYITYPRTETTKYSSEFDFKSVLKAIANTKFNKLNNYASTLLNQPLNKQFKGVDSGDHPPITPTQNSPQFLNPQQQKIYELVCRNFMGSLSQDSEFENTTYSLTSGKHEFQLNKSILLSSGYLDIITWDTVSLNDPQIGQVQVGDKIDIESIELLTLLTQPPSFLSESELIGLMELNGIGTDASMSQHINNIVLRQYVKVSTRDRQLIPTQLGVALIHAYKEIDNELVAPELRRRMEEQISQIAKGEMTKETLVDAQIKIFKQKYENFVAQSSRLDFHFDLISDFLRDCSHEEEKDDESSSNSQQSRNRDNGYQNRNYNQRYNNHHHQQYQQKHQGGYQQQQFKQRNNQNQQDNNNNNSNNNNYNQGQRYQRKDGANFAGNNNRQGNQYKQNNNNNNGNHPFYSDQSFPNIMEQLNPANLAENSTKSTSDNNNNISEIKQQPTQEQNKQPQHHQQQQGFQKKKQGFKKQEKHQYVQKDKKPFSGGENEGSGDQQAYMLASDCIEKQLENMQNMKQTKKKQRKNLQEEDEQNQQA